MGSGDDGQAELVERVAPLRCCTYTNGRVRRPHEVILHEDEHRRLVDPDSACQTQITQMCWRLPRGRLHMRCFSMKRPNIWIPLAWAPWLWAPWLWPSLRIEGGSVDADDQNTDGNSGKDGSCSCPVAESTLAVSR